METVTVTMADEWTAPLRLCPARAESRPAAAGPAVLIVPGSGVAAGYYELFARALAATGTDVAIAELKGQLNRLGSPANYDYHGIVNEHLHAHVCAARQRFPGPPVVLVGHSIGGQLAALYAARQPDWVSGLALIASGSNYQRCYRPAARGLLLAASMAHNIKLSPGDIKSPWAALCEYPPAFRRDWAHVVRNGNFDVAGADAGYEHLLARLTLDVLAIDVRGDRLAPKTSIDPLLCKMPQAAVTRWQEPGAGHNGWILNFAPTVQRLASWLDQLNTDEPPPALANRAGRHAESWLQGPGDAP